MLNICRAVNVLVVCLVMTHFIFTPSYAIISSIKNLVSEKELHGMEKPKSCKEVFFPITGISEYRTSSSDGKLIIPFEGMRFVSTKMLWKTYIGRNFDHNISKEQYLSLVDIILLYYFNSEYASWRSAELVAQLTSNRVNADSFSYEQFHFLNKHLQIFFMPNKVTNEGYRQFADFAEIRQYDPNQFEGKLRFSQYYGLVTHGILVSDKIDNDRYLYEPQITLSKGHNTLNLTWFPNAKLVH